MANTIDFNVNSNAVNVLNQTALAANNTAEATKNAKQELKELQKQMLSLDADSAEFQKAAARAGELKDQMGDAADAIRTSTGPALESMNSTFSIMSGQIANLDIGGLGQSFTSLGRAVGKINLQTLKSELGGLVSGLGNLAGAIISNPLLALGGVVAALVLNFDKINEALSGTAEKVEKLGEANVALEKQNQILDARINKEKTLYGESFRTLELEKEKAQNNIQVAENELAIARTTGDINTIREKENKLIEMRNLLSGITSKGEADRIKLIEEAKNITIAGYKEDQTRKAAIAKFEDARAQQLAVIAEKQRLIKGNLQKEELIGTEQQYTTERANFVQKDIETKKVLVQSDRQKQLQAELNKLLEEEQILRNAKLAIATDTTVQDLAKLEKEKKDVKDVKEVAKREELGVVYDLELEYNLKLVDEEQLKQNKLNEIALQGHQTRLLFTEEYKSAVIGAEQQLYDARWALANASIDLLGTLFAKNKKAADVAFVLQKALAIGQIVVDTQREIAGYWANPTWKLSPDGGATLATAASLGAKLRAAAGIAVIAGTTIGKFMGGGGAPSGGGGGGGGGAGGGGGTTAPSPANFAFLGNQPNQQPPLQAYVVSSQVSSNLEAQQLIQNQSKLGG
tara:strand:+ start:193 stop:2079 length:1887 start_codon:yes stop_codon:yes gene_type:complete